MTATPNSNTDFSLFYTLLDKHSTNSYKHLFLASIVYFAHSGYTEIDLKLCAAMMIHYAWKPVTEYNLSLGKQDGIAPVIKDLRFLPFFDTCSDGYSVYKYLSENSNQYFDELVGTLINYVPYRLLSPFYEDKLKRLPDQVKNSTIMELSAKDPNSFYVIRKDKLVLNQKWCDFININYTTVCNYLSDRFLAYLIKRNPNVEIKYSFLIFDN